MAAPFYLKCLGVPELRQPDGRVVRVRVKKHLALLIYLAVERRRTQDRAGLVELLWPKSAAEKARHSCATALSELRTIVGRHFLTSTGDVIRVTPGAIALDLEVLERGSVIGADGEALIDVDGFLRGFDIH